MGIILGIFNYLFNFLSNSIKTIDLVSLLM